MPPSFSLPSPSRLVWPLPSLRFSLSVARCVSEREGRGREPGARVSERGVGENLGQQASEGGGGVDQGRAISGWNRTGRGPGGRHPHPHAGHSRADAPPDPTVPYDQAALPCIPRSQRRGQRAHVSKRFDRRAAANALRSKAPLPTRRGQSTTVIKAPRISCDPTFALAEAWAGRKLPLPLLRRRRPSLTYIPSLSPPVVPLPSLGASPSAAITLPWRLVMGRGVGRGSSHGSPLADQSPLRPHGLPQAARQQTNIQSLPG